MESLINLAQIVVALSVLFVWTLRFHNVLKEFKQFGLSDLTRNLVGATKISLANKEKKNTTVEPLLSNLP